MRQKVFQVVSLAPNMGSCAILARPLLTWMIIIASPDLGNEHSLNLQALVRSSKVGIGVWLACVLETNEG